METTWQWTEAHRLGIPGVDQEHAAFFTLLRALEVGVSRGDDLASREALASLRHHAAAHFAHEEAFLEAVGYPELQRHRAEHAEFLRDVAGLQEVPGLPTAGAVRMARAWLGQHILGTDRRYTAWLDATEAPAPATWPVTA